MAPTNASFATARRELTVHFAAPDAGWIEIEVCPLADWTILASYLTSNFAGMLQWLEAILGGAECTRWAIDEEGSLTELIFFDTGRRLSFDMPPTALVATRICHIPNLPFGFLPIGRMEVVRAFYTSFRHYAETTYNASEWDTYDPKEEEGWSGEPIDALRSEIIEAALRKAATDTPERGHHLKT